LLCFSDKFDQDISDKLFKSTALKVWTIVNFCSSHYVPELRSAALRHRTFPIHPYTRRRGLEENSRETSVFPREVVCHSRAIVCELITAVLTRQQLWFIYLLVCARIRRGQSIVPLFPPCP
jgi:hypothetical protein